MADIASNLYSWSATASANAPTGATLIGTGMDDNLREIQAVVRSSLASVGANIASAGTTDLGAVAGLRHLITGTTTITSFGTVSAGIWKVIVFEGALVLTHNATSLILPSAANITTAAGDVAVVQSEGSGNWRCLSYQRASGLALVESNTQRPMFTATRSITTGETLSITDGYQILLGGGGGTFTISMPDSATLPNGWYTRIVNNGAILSISRSGSDTFVGPGLTVATTTGFSLPYTGADGLAFNTGAVTLHKFGSTWRVDFDSQTHGAATFTSGGTWTCPFGVNTVWVSAAAGGGGGGGSNGSLAAGGGGGGGQTVLKTRTVVVPGTAYTVTIGAGGTAGANTGGNGGTGGTTSVGALLSLTGGSGGVGSTSGGTAGGAAGGAGGQAGAGGLSASGVGNFPGAGGGTIFGPPSSQGAVSSGGAGQSGAGYGSGGSGAAGSSQTGGAGAAGFVVIEW